MRWAKFPLQLLSLLSRDYCFHIGSISNSSDREIEVDDVKEVMNTSRITDIAQLYALFQKENESKRPSDRL